MNIPLEDFKRKLLERRRKQLQLNQLKAKYKNKPSEKLFKQMIVSQKEFNIVTSTF